MTKENPIVLFTLTHTNYSLKGGNTLLSPLYFLLLAQLSLLDVFFFSKRLPLGCFLFSLMLPLSLSLLYVAHTKNLIYIAFVYIAFIYYTHSHPFNSFLRNT